MKLVKLWIALTVLLVLPSRAQAHLLAPVAFAVEEHGQEIIATVKRARVQPRGAAFSPRFPSFCRPIAAVSVSQEPTFVVSNYRLRCSRSLVGAELGMDGLSEAKVDAIVRVTLEDGRVRQGLLDRSDDVYVVPAGAATWEVARSFARLGLWHLLGGLDHVLFVLGLALLLQRTRRVLLALTAFTAGHSLSMGATALGLISIPSLIAETAIAATLVWLAYQLVERRSAGPKMRRPYLACLGVGLVHGLGFASAFSAAGLSGPGLPLALGAFHLGIEAGQVLVVLAALISVRVVTQRRHLLVRSTGYAIGGLAFMWLIERAMLIGS